MFSELGETDASLPQAARQTTVEGPWVGLRQRLTDDVAAVKGRGVGHRREKKRHLGPLLGTRHERFHQPPHQLGQATAVEKRCDDAGPFKPFPQLATKEDVTELRPSVGFEGAPIARLSKLAKGEPVAAMRLRSNGDNPRRRRSPEAFEQQVRQQERPDG